jgi:predicted flap endonuclease-1-like 5' DNA nuclease
MMLTFVQVFGVIILTVASSYFLIRYLNLKDKTDEMQHDIEDIRSNLEHIQQIKEDVSETKDNTVNIIETVETIPDAIADVQGAVEQIPLIIEQKIEASKVEIIEAQSQIADEVKAGLIPFFESNLEHFGKMMDQFEEQQIFAAGMRDKIEGYIDHKIDHVIRCIDEIPEYDMTQQQDDFDKINRSLFQIAEMIEEVDKRDSTPEQIFALNNKIDLIIAKQVDDELKAASQEPSDNVVSLEKERKKKEAKKKRKIRKDDLTQIDGIGKYIQRLLNRKFKIYRLHHIAELDRQKIKEINDVLFFKGRIQREKWVVQARRLLRQQGKKWKQKKKAA